MAPVSSTGAATAAEAVSAEDYHARSARPSARQKLKLSVARLAIVLAGIFSLRYFIWRVADTANPAAMWFFVVFLILELLNFTESALFYFIAWNPTRYLTPPPLHGRTVDVYITTYNESLELLRETAVCAVSMMYPHRTYILDDGNRPEVAALAREVHSEYIARGTNEDAKAGNLNFALPRSSGEFIVTLDADHVPSPDMIDQVLGFFADPTVGIVQLAQDFYNLDSFQHLTDPKSKFGWQQQELFFNVIQPGKDYHRSAFYCGSPAVLRRSALEEIGGFATGTVTEDMHTGLRMQKAGHHVLYHNKTLARGLAPQTYIAFATQWRRWGHGAMQVLRQERPLGGVDLTIGQRLCYFASFYFYWMSYQKLLYILTPIFCLLTGIFPLMTEPSTFLAYFGPYFVFNTLASVLLQGGLRNFLLSEQFNLLKMKVLMQSMGGLIHLDFGFKVTPKARSGGARLSDLMLQIGILLALMFGAYKGFQRLSTLPMGYEFWAISVNLFWVCFYIMLLVPLIIRCLRRKELRSSYRWPARLDLPLRCYRAGSDLPIVTFARNLNRFGVSITTSKPLADNEMVRIELELPNKTISALCRVMRTSTFQFKSETKASNGVKFEQIMPKDQDEISKFLFFEIAPREGTLLRLTHSTQELEGAAV